MVRAGWGVAQMAVGPRQVTSPVGWGTAAARPAEGERSEIMLLAGEPAPGV